MKNDAWLAGFTDGEGSFNICTSYKDTFIPRFKISLRGDDAEVLQELQSHFGGFVNLLGGAKYQRHVAQWVVAGKRDLAVIVDYFDRFPLRAKKARDYRIWRVAALAYCEKGSAAPELAPLREALMRGRAYEATDDDLDEGILESPQLRLVG